MAGAVVDTWLWKYCKNGNDRGVQEESLFIKFVICCFLYDGLKIGF